MGDTAASPPSDLSSLLLILVKRATSTDILTQARLTHHRDRGSWMNPREQWRTRRRGPLLASFAKLAGHYRRAPLTTIVATAVQHPLR